MVRIAALKALAQRFSFTILLLSAFALMMLGKVDAVLIDGMRARITDAVAPILDALAEPAATVAGIAEAVNDLARLREENARLRRENAELRRYHAAAHLLEAENLSLHALLNYRPDTPYTFITARVIADNSGAFVRSVAVNVGAGSGLRDGMAVLGGRGLIGRTVQTGARSARILLINDLNARIPVMVEQSRYRAILGGDNTERPRLLYLPPEAQVKVGDRVVTSGHGGLFPPGLPVGIVAAVEEAEVRVQPMEALGRLEYVRIVDFLPRNTDMTAMRAAAGHARAGHAR